MSAVKQRWDYPKIGNNNGNIIIQQTTFNEAL